VGKKVREEPGRKGLKRSSLRREDIYSCKKQRDSYVDGGSENEKKNSIGQEGNKTG